MAEKEFEGQELSLDRIVYTIEALYYCGLYAEAEAGARRVLKILSDSERRGFNHFEATAARYLKAALVAQRKADDALDIEIQPTSADDLFMLKNLDAAGLINQGQPANARNLLNQILQERPADPMASANLVYSYATEDKWDEALAAAKRARDVMPKGQVPDQILQLEAMALWRLQRFDESAQSVRELSAAGRAHPQIVQLRLDLMLTTAPDYRLLKDDLDRMAKTDPVLAGKLRARLAPARAADLSGLIYTDLPLARIKFEDRVKNAFHETPAQHFLNMLQLGCRTLTEHPSLVEALDNEDYVTQLLAWNLESTLKPLNVEVVTNIRGGLGPKKEGVADLQIYDSELDGHHRSLVKGEAKYWDGPEALFRNMGQVFGTANTGGELFSVALIYSRAKDFAEVVSMARSAIKSYSVDVDGQPDYLCVADIEDVTDRNLAGERVYVLRSVHERRGSPLRRTVYTFILDTKSHDARSARKNKIKATAKKAMPKRKKKAVPKRGKKVKRNAVDAINPRRRRRSRRH